MKLELNDNELKIIAAALQELPFKLSNPVLKNIQAQYDEANKPKEPNEETKTTVKKR
jgi:hypothetical protein